MSFICIDNTEIQGIGFVSSTMPIDRTEIKDAIEGRGDELNKMSSSIPTPFSRLFMYANAFKEVNNIQMNDVYHGHEGVTSYHALVNEWMDFLEFLYVYGNTPEMTVYEWGKNDIDILEESGNRKHRRLATALAESLKQTPNLGEDTTINLFRYGNHIVGGTSPVSILYLSPNWRTSMQQSNLTFPRSGNDNGFLFDNKLVCLATRDIEFRKFVYMFVERVINSGVETSPEINYIFTYIRDERRFYDTIEENRFQNSLGLVGDQAYDAAFNERNYRKIKDIKDGTVSVRGIDLWSLNPRNITLESDYTLNTECTRWKDEVVHGGVVHIDHVPLVLSQQGIDNAWYDRKRNLRWNRNWMIPTPMDSTLSNRELPGLPNMIYPYITIDDLLESKIIFTPFDVHKSRFFTGSNQSLECLLPLKKEFFRYFDVSDLVKYNVENGNFVLTDMLTIEETERDNAIPKFKVTLKVPVQRGLFVEFVRTYENKDVIVCSERGHIFDLAIFPFYRYTSGNVYNVMLGYVGNPKAVNFYDVNDLSTPLPCNPSIRSEAPLNTVHMHLDRSFDIIEFSVEGTTGLAIPLMRNITVQNMNLVFCVDFGTSNTHVVYGEQGRVAGIKSLDINDTLEDLQVVYLNDHRQGNPYGGFGTASSFINIVKREFVPAVIGSDADLSFPLATNICEQFDLRPGNVSLFSQMNIGFNYQNEIGNTARQCNYVTNIKWKMGGHDPLGNDRVRIYFEELMWIIKNKSVLLGGGLNFQFVFTYPQSMKRFSVSRLQQLWEDARIKVGAAPNRQAASILIKKRLEGVAPYFCPRNDFGRAQKYVNIDIGGGTTDIIFIDPQPGGDKLSYSAVFAANDIWGDGVVVRQGKDNGFVTAYEQSEFFKAKDDQDPLKMQYYTIKDRNSTTSSDLINFLFAHDDYFHFTDSFDNDICSALKPILLVHLTSIVYYLGLSLKRDGLEELPAIMSFTGMGSKYILLLGNDETVTDIVRAVLAYAVGNVFDRNNINAVNVVFQDHPKEVTAEGGVRMFDDQVVTINPVQSLPYGWKDEEYSETHIEPVSINQYKKTLMEEFDKFLNMFADPTFIRIVKETCDFNPCGIKDGLSKLSKDSFDEMHGLVMNSAQPGDLVDEPMFFWPLKDSLYHYGKTLV